jgi:DNA repair protein RecO (recombination protein O)
MKWVDDAIVLYVRPFGETSVVLEVLTRTQGRSLGLVRGGRSKRLRPLLQTGNLLHVQWRARLSEQLGTFSVEMIEPFAAQALDNRLTLAGLSTLTRFACLLPERDPHSALFDLGVLLLNHLEEPALWPQLLVRWELLLLRELGFGLDLEQCAATGSRSDLVYVSPKSGSAVSAEAGKPYADRLFTLPPFLHAQTALANTAKDVADGLKLTGFFLQRHVLEPRGLSLPEERAVIQKALETT